MTDAAPGAPLYPLGLRVQGRRVVVVGAGPVAARRVRALLQAGADVLVVAPDAVDEVAGHADAGHLGWERRAYRPGDLAGAWLVHVATGDPAVDAAVAGDAEAQGTWCVTAADAGLATAWTPAVARTTLDDGAEVTVAVNAGGDPGRARAVRDAVAVALDTGELPLRATRPGTPGTGSVALVGGGPGDDGLLTTRGRHLLAQADVVVVDRLAPRGVLADLVDDVEVVDVGKTSGHHPVPQDEINRVLVDRALAGNRVVRLKGGDPYVFGRGGEEAEACRAADVPVEVVPGVTSAVAVPAAAGIPVTHRGLARGFTVLTGHESVGAVPAAPDHTLVLLMGVSHLAATADALVAHGRSPDTPVAVVEDGYGPRFRTTVATLGTLARTVEEAEVRPPAVVVVGDVVTLSPAWRDRR
ncbi:uroporphyrinogen-III C-methyltransferase [Luteimicrobium xylanilyticum]|uniref:Uroporphyrinogen-III C-methyltransferase n=1 Tax=Luteimicrobium xylanilyticum TaxID=1133546 RepID=A0A5P9Q800_9MICO|nr:uroporphyrinogen-III C-methyltransferase [Luteimicrobium xylanilyticum]QFU97416.1 Uroporphyrinogen-III C-methyltransferase [Luteimicrobium xylanilyticum]